MCELLWSDPQAENGRSPSKRGVGVAFGMLQALQLRFLAYDLHMPLWKF